MGLDRYTLGFSSNYLSNGINHNQYVITMKAFCFDTETTELIKNHSVKLDKQPHVIEFYGALVNLDNGEIIAEIESLVKPPIIIPEEHIKHTPVNQAMVENAPNFASIANDIALVIEDAPCVLAHNLSYDKEMIDIEFERLGRKLKWPRLICTVEQTVFMKGYRLKLADLYEMLFGEKFADAHRAKADTQALIRCAVELTKRGIL